MNSRNKKIEAAGMNSRNKKIEAAGMKGRNNMIEGTKGAGRIGKALAVVLAMLMAMAMLAGCGSQGSGGSDSSGSSADVSIDSLKTMGEAFELDVEDDQLAVYENKVVYAFRAGDSYYRLRADISEEDMQAYMDIEFDDPDYETKEHAILDPLEITQVEDLTDMILSQEELDALVGKTGQELVDEGWAYQGSYFLDDMEVWMNYGPFEYSIKFDGSTDLENDDDFDIEEVTKDMKVKSADFSMLGDATNID